MKRKIKAFTLVELVVVIALVMMLSVISVPVYRTYTDKVALAEGYALLGRIRTAQENYYSEWGNFLYDKDSDCGSSKYTAHEHVLGINAIPNKYFKKFNIDNWTVGGNMAGVLFYAEVKYEKAPGVSIWKKLMYNLTTGATYY